MDVNSDAKSHLGRYFLEQMKQRDPNEICMIDAGTEEELSVACVLRRSVRVARCFRRLGLKAGDVLALAGTNHVNLRIPYYAAMMVGLPVVGVDPMFKYHEIKWLLNLTKAKIVFCQYESYETYHDVAKDLGADLTIVTFGGGENSFEKFIEAYDDDAPIDDFEADNFDLNTTYAWLVSTSGSLGLPKLAAFTHRGLADVTIQWVKLQGISKTKRLLIVSPAQWLSAFTNAYGTLVVGACIVQTSNPDDTGHLIDVINKYKPNGVVSSPSIQMLILNHEKKCNYECFDVICMGGTKVHNNVVHKLRPHLRKDTMIREMYGQSESGGMLLASNRDTPVGSCGTLQDQFYTVKLVDSDTGVEVNGPHKTGELWYKGQPRFQNYFYNPEETARTFEDGWLKSGDLFYHDDKGNYFFVERLKMVIKYRNFAIVPPELEEVILTHPDVQEVAVTGVLHATDGQHPVACVVRRPGATVTAQDIKDLVASHLTATKQLRGGVIFVEELPRTSTGKVARKLLEEIALNAHRE